MSNFIIRKDCDGSIHEMTCRAMSKLLADPQMLGQLLRELCPDMTMKIELTDGLASIQRSPRKPSQPSQQLLRLPQPALPTQPYLADGDLLLVLPARIRRVSRSSRSIISSASSAPSAQTPPR